MFKRSGANEIPAGEPGPAQYAEIVLNDPAHNTAEGSFADNYISTTKYTFITFLPKNLFEQFRRLTNFYFLLITIITLLPEISPITPLTTVLALVFVLSVTAIKEAIEDISRYRADREVNYREFRIVTPNGSIEKRMAYKLSVGDVIELRADEPMPADLLLLSSSAEANDGSAYIETASLDGETNLKRRVALPCTSDVAGGRSRDGCASLKGRVACEPPHHAIYEFKARVSLDNEDAASAGPNQLLPRGAFLRNTKWARALVIYCGRDTKLSLNAREPPSKFSTIENRLNRIIAGVFGFKLVLITALTIGHGIWNSANSDGATYLESEEDAVLNMVKVFFSFFVLLSYLIPISLMVTYEVSKSCQALFMYWDEKMKNKDGHMMPKTSNLNDELALVKFIFSDKTGTLTENRMNFAKCSVRAQVLDVNDSSTIFDTMRSAPARLTDVSDGTPKSRRKMSAAEAAREADDNDDDEDDNEDGDAGDSKRSSKKSKKKDDKKKRKNSKASRKQTMDENEAEMFVSTKDDLQDFLLVMGLCHTLVVQSDDDDDDDDDNASANNSRGGSKAAAESGTELAQKKSGGKAEKDAKKSKKKAAKKGKKKGKKGAIDSDDEDDDDLGAADGAETRADAGPAPPIPHAEFVAPRYTGQSPDEVALARAATNNGVAFMGSNKTIYTLRVRDPADDMWHEQRYEILATLEFSSDRRRMSVIVRRPDDRIVLFCKGADYIVSHRLESSTSQQLREATQNDINGFSRTGLRTLMLASRSLSKSEYDTWAKKWLEATTRIDDGREEAMEELMSEVESEMRLLGCTAIEDALQEFVPETIAYLLRANISLWVITGDKQETAINIGYSSRLLKIGAPLVKLNATTSEICGELLDEALRTYVKESVLSENDSSVATETIDSLGIVIDGNTLKFALQDHSEAFLKLALHAAAVVCCRVTPLQKAKVVELVKYHCHGDVTLAIGDGANDVSMIQAAHIGVGIYGNEGGQAARASDYALRQFSHLQRLVCVHGRYALVRNAGLVNYFMYKNVAFVFVQALFAFRSGFSAQTVYDDWLLTMYNVLYTSAPPFFYSIFEKDVSERALARYPQLNRDVQHGRQFSHFTALQWMLLGLAHACVLYYAGVLAFPDSLYDTEGRTGGLFVFGSALGTAGYFMVLFVAALMHKHWVWPTYFGFFISVFIFTAFSVAEDVAGPSWPTMEGVFAFVFAQASYWVYMVLVNAICLLPIVAWNFFQQQYFPSPSDILREVERDLKNKSESIRREREDSLDDSFAAAALTASPRASHA